MTGLTGVAWHARPYMAQTATNMATTAAGMAAVRNVLPLCHQYKGHARAHAIAQRWPEAFLKLLNARLRYLNLSVARRCLPKLPMFLSGWIFNMERLYVRLTYIGMQSTREEGFERIYARRVVSWQVG